MSELKLIGPRLHDLGDGFIVRRLLPAVGQQSVGPFIFFDHFGPVLVKPGKGNNVRPHPHIGLATVSYLFEGAIMHRDTLGSVQLVEPGAVNLMASGKGIVHSEREPESLKGTGYQLHGLQLWLALPAHLEEMDPVFMHTPASAIPTVTLGDAHIRILIGQVDQQISSVTAFTDTLYLDVQLAANGKLTLPVLAEEMGLYAVSGAMQIDGVTVAANTFVVLPANQPVTISTTEALHLMVVGGAALPEKRTIWWNFVSTRKDRIIQAAEDWEHQRMGTIEGDEEFIPLPPVNWNN